MFRRLRLWWCLRRLQNKSSYVRQEAVRGLGMLRHPHSLDPLIALLADEDMCVRRAAATALGELSDARAVEPLSDALSDDHRPLREIAATALGELRDARAVEPLIKALLRVRRDRSSDDDVHTLSCLAQSLATLGDPRAVRPLMESTVDRSSVVRRAAVDALAKLGQDQWTIWVKGDEEDFSRLADCGDPDLVEPFILALRDPCGNVRCAAAGALGKLHDVRSLAPLISALRDDCANVRCAAAEALRKLRDVRSVAPLIQGLGDSESSVRCACAEALGELRDARAVEPLIDHLGRRDRAGDGTFIAVVLKALAHLRDVRARPLLVHFLLDYRSDVCAEAAIALGELGDRSAVPPLVQMLGRRDAALRRAAADALAKLGEVGWGTCIKGDSQDMSRLGACRDPRVVEPLVLALREWCSEEREAAARALGNCRDGRAIDPLIQCLTDSDPAVRCACAEALAKLRHRRAVPALLHTLVDHVPEVRRAAVDALEGLGEKKWRRWVKGDSQDASRLGDSGDERLVEPLIRALFEHDSGSADALGRLGHRRIIERLCPVLRDDSKDRRRKAARALIAVAKYHPSLIGEQWNEIQRCVTQPHVDAPIHRDHSDHPATDCYPSETHEIIGHDDHGIGLAFPDWPVRGPAVPAEIVVPIEPETLFAVCPNPKCGKQLQTTSEYIGRTAKCPFCRKTFCLQGPSRQGPEVKRDF